MRCLSILALLGVASLATAGRRSPMHVGKPHDYFYHKRSEFSKAQHQHELEAPPDARIKKRSIYPEIKHHRRAGATVIPQNKNTTRYAVDGTGLPEVVFDIGESYAGLMPTSDKQGEKRELFFWFFPSTNPDAKDEITIWLNGGPGCSSLEGLFQENGPVIWQYGTFRPVKNPWTWVRLTNMLWVEQPVGTGFSQGKPTATSTEETAHEFLGFFKRFIDTFGLHNKKIYITGESYAGYYVPYIADAMLNNGNKKYYDLNGIMIYDPSTNTDALQEYVPALPFAQYHHNLFNLNSTLLAKLERLDKSCGYAEFREKYFKFPPPAKTPAAPRPRSNECLIFDQIFYAASDMNPCFDIYQVATTCPLLWDVLGFPGSFDYSPAGSGKVYFDRPDVQKAINAPIQKWAECQNGVLNTDNSPPSGLSVLPGVINRAKRTVIAHGQIDMVLIPNGTLMMIQNMTFGGKKGFQTEPSTPFYVPFHNRGKPSTLAGAGTFGITHTERKLTWVEVFLSGHMVPQYAPSAAFRQLEFLLGRVSSLSSKTPFTVSPPG